MRNSDHTDKLYILGLDGLTPELISAWSQKGLMPNLKRFLHEGYNSVMTGEMPPVSPPAWTSIFTGRTMKNHGIVDFGRESAEGDNRLTDSRDRCAYSMWELAGLQDVESVTVNVPISWPPQPSDEKWLTQADLITGMHSPSLEEAIWPLGNIEDICSHNPEYIIDVNSEWYGDDAVLREALLTMTSKRLEMLEYFLNRRNPRLITSVFVAVDRILHPQYHRMLQNGFNESDLNNQMAESIFEVHRKIDHVIGAMMQRCGKNDTVMIVSDHGFGPRYGDVNLNRIFQREDLTIRNENGQFKPECFHQGSFTTASVNLMERQHEGIVKHQDYVRTLWKMRKALSEATGIADGRLICADHIWSRNSLKEAFQPGWDLAVSFDNWGWTPCRDEISNSLNKDGESTFWFNIDRTGGTHRPEGVFGLWGHGVKPFNGIVNHNGKSDINRVKHVDVLPTAFRLLGITVPDDVEGTVVNCAIDESISPLITGEPAGKRIFKNKDLYSDSDSEYDETMKRLQAIGYA